MPSKTTKTKKAQSLEITKEKKAGKNLVRLITFENISKLLSVTFYAIWIVVGIYFLLIVYSQIRTGAIAQLIRTENPETQQAPEVSAPVETTLEGVGKVNIECVQNALTTESIQSLITEKGTSKLSAEEKTKLEACIIKDNSSPSPNSNQ